jgi:MoaE-MoaD fusion protein
MRVTLRLFAGLRERAGRDVVEVDLPEGATAADALAEVQGLAPGVPLVLAVNREYATPETALTAGDELAVVPPVSGGEADAAAGAVHAAIVEGPISLDALTERVRDPRAGALVTFSGTTRDVEHLDYEAYAEMAQERLARIVAEAVERHGLCAAAAEHRVGRVPLGEASIVIAASAPHRPEAFAGAREVIDRVKAEVPMWKREDGVWKQEHVPSAE